MIGFSDVAMQSTIGRMLRAPLRLIPPNLTVPICQGRLRGMKWVAGSFNHGCWLGTYELKQHRAFEAAVQEGDVVFDVGAHVGFYTLLASVLVGPTGSVFAFEPYPRNLTYLLRHLLLNGISNVTVITSAVSDRRGTMHFAEGPDHSTGHLASQGRLRVSTVGLDRLVADGELPAPDCIKIDVEGGEASVLSGARAILEDVGPKLFLSTHGTPVRKECHDFLRDRGYRLQSLGQKAVDHAGEVLAIREKRIMVSDTSNA